MPNGTQDSNTGFGPSVGKTLQPTPTNPDQGLLTDGQEYVLYGPVRESWWRRVRWWAWVVIAACMTLYITGGLLPLYYLNQVQVPAFEKLQRTDGKVFFKRIRGKNGGHQLGLELPNGEKKLFTCSIGFGSGPGCISIVEAEKQFGRKFSRQETPGSVFTKVTMYEELAGMSGTIWWFRLQDHVSHSRTYALRVDIQGKTVHTNESAVKHLNFRIREAKRQIGFMGMMLLVITIGTLYRGVRNNE